MKSARGTSLRVSAALLIVAACSSYAKQRDDAAPLALEECRIEHPRGVASHAARCGVLEVAENPEQPSGRKIGLRVAVVPAINRRGARDPLFILSGGPGQAATDFYASAAPAFARIQRERDLVLLDQRGTGGSNALTCPFPDEAELAELDMQRIGQYSRDCLAKLAGDPRYYTTSVAVRDLDAVRAALGYERVNLYGISYGTRVAQHYLRRYPQRARAVVLDGVVPPQQILGIDSALLAQRALERIFERCHSETACRDAFPDPAGQFATLRAEVARRPAEIALPDPATGSVERIKFSSGHLQVSIRLLTYSSDRAALIPLLVQQAVKQRNYAPLAAHAQMISEQLGDALAVGMHNAVVCTEDVPYYGASAIDRRALAQTYLGTMQLDGLVASCEAWPRGMIDPDFHAPLLSSTPVLLLSGSVDPVTPPEYAERAAATLRNARHLVMSGHGHGQLAIGCMPRVMADFIDGANRDDIAQTLDTGCLAKAAPAPFFVSFAGPTP